MFEFLFKYRPILFERGDVVMGARWYVLVIGLAVAALAVPTVLQYTRARGKSSSLDRGILMGLRIAVLAIVLFVLARPTLVLSTVVPQKNFVGVLLDDSRSMQIADDQDTPRGQFISQQFDAETGELLKALSEKFIVRLYRFSDSPTRIADAKGMTFVGDKTDVGRAIDHARQELANVPLAGLVVVTDGADNSGQTLADPLLALQAQAVPVHTVGLGRDVFARDVQLTRVQTPRTVLNGTSLVVDLMVSQRGYSGTPVELIVEDDGRIVSSQTITLGGNGEAIAARVHFTVTEPGPRLFKFRIPPLENEMVLENNEQHALVVVQDATERILYFEGEPRPEYKFIRRAVEDDENIEVVGLLRTAENKFFRQGIEDENELIEGFPKTREELFSYRALVLGSVEASFFTHDQLRMIADFVSERGGGLLVLGGRRALARGGYIGTPVEDVLPVVLEQPGEEEFFVEVGVEVTPAGRMHAATQIAPSEDASADRWPELPPVLIVNPMTEVKPGATTLLKATGAEPYVILATQRYGRGKTAVLGMMDSWVYQMAADIPLDDMTHETFWRQLLRYIVSFVPERVSVTSATDQVVPGEPVRLTATVEDDAYLKVNNTDVQAFISTPLGDETTTSLEWSVDRDGEYVGMFVPDTKGLYEFRVEARQEGEFVASSSSYVHVADLPREFYGAEMQASSLKRIAEETGGGFYTPANVSTLPEDISFTESGTTVIEHRDLWDMPVIFLLLVGLMSTEWGYRRVRGLV